MLNRNTPIVVVGQYNGLALLAYGSFLDLNMVIFINAYFLYTVNSTSAFASAASSATTCTDCNKKNYTIRKSYF